MADTKLRYTAPDIATRTSSSSSFYNPSQPYGLLSNSSFNHLDMFNATLSPAGSSRSRQPTDSSFASSLTSFEYHQVQRVRISGIRRRFQRARLHHFRPQIQDRREGSSLPMVQVEGDIQERDRASMEERPVLFGLEDSMSHRLTNLFYATDQPEPMLLGTSSQRSRRVATLGMTDQEIATSKAREAHVQKTMETLTFSPDTVDSVSLATPPLAMKEAIPQMFLPKRPVHTSVAEQGLGFGQIDSDPLPLLGREASRVSASSDDYRLWNSRFTLPSSTDSPRPPSRLPTAATASSLGILGVSSYYRMTESELGLAPSEASVRIPSRLGQTQQSGSEKDLTTSRFAFSPPPLPDIPTSTVARPSTAVSLMPGDSISRPGSTSASPHRIRRKPVPELSFEEFVKGQEVKSRCNLDLANNGHTVPRFQAPRTVYIDKSASRSVSAFTLLSPKTSAGSGPSETKTTTMQNAIDSLKAFGARYRTGSFGKRGEAVNSLSTICTGESIQTPRESYESILDVPVTRVDRDIGFASASHVDLAATSGYTTRRQRQEAERTSGEQKTEGRLAKFFFR